MYYISPYGYSMYAPYAPTPYGPVPDITADMSRVSISPSTESQEDHQVPLLHHVSSALATSHPSMAPLHASAPVFVPAFTMQQQHESIVPIPGELVSLNMCMMLAWVSYTFVYVPLAFIVFLKIVLLIVFVYIYVCMVVCVCE